MPTSERMQVALVLLVVLSSADATNTSQLWKVACTIKGGTTTCADNTCCTDPACEFKFHGDGKNVVCCDLSNSTVKDQMYSGQIFCSQCPRCSKYYEYFILLV